MTGVVGVVCHEDLGGDREGVRRPNARVWGQTFKDGGRGELTVHVEAGGV